MATGTAGDVGQVFYTNQLHYLVKRVTYDDFGTESGDNRVQTVGWLPPGAVVLRGTTKVITGFNDTDGDDLQVGVEGDDANLFASAVDVNSGATTAFNDVAAANDYSASARKVVCSLVTAASGDGTAGEALIIVEYVPAGQHAL